MKKLLFAVIFLCSMLAFTSCRQNRTRTIRVENDNMSLTVTYVGKVRFNQEGNGIKSISPRGYVSYKKDDKKLFAENDGHGGIRYEVRNGSMDMDHEEAKKQLITEAVQDMLRLDAESRK